MNELVRILQRNSFVLVDPLGVDPMALLRVAFQRCLLRVAFRRRLLRVAVGGRPVIRSLLLTQPGSRWNEVFVNAHLPCVAGHGLCNENQAVPRRDFIMCIAQCLLQV